MKETNWEECLVNNSARVITPDVMRAKSLLEVANERISLVNEITIKNCNFVFEDYYTSLIETIQSIAFKKGFNILNHVCLGFFFREHMQQEELFIKFDDLRYKRNSLTYYGNKMDFLTAKKAIETCKNMIKMLNY